MVPLPWLPLLGEVDGFPAVLLIGGAVEAVGSEVGDGGGSSAVQRSRISI